MIGNTIKSFMCKRNYGIRSYINEADLPPSKRKRFENLPVRSKKNKTEMNNDLTEPKLLGVSLMDYFSIEQLKDHIRNLSKYNHRSTETMSERSVTNNVCQLCSMDSLDFVPTPIYCSSCYKCIKRNLIYYWAVDESDGRHCYCNNCFRKCSSKNKFQKAKNNYQNEEPWVQCDKCECWQHQICGLYNANEDLEGQAKYTCPFCRLKDIEAGEHMPLPVSIGAQHLPRTMLSDHIEQRLFRCLELDRNERAKYDDEVPVAADLTVRVVLSVNRNLKVNQQFLDIFQNDEYPSEFQYKSKLILLFQKIGGVDVCLFGMYVQEFGSECAPPNRRCVYISYLDSINYFTPDIRTVKGEALRTFVYHEILIGYMDYCKKRGFTTCYLWACPSLKGEDYILYCHPKSQKTPKPEKLRLWYKSMLKKASEEGIVVSHTNLYDQFFGLSTRNSAAHLPYFNGDYWSGAAEEIIRNIEKENRADKAKKLMTKSTLKAIGNDNVYADATKDILVMQKLGQTILPVKEEFIVVNLHFVCVICQQVILSESRWSCKQCKSFHLCTKCVALQKTHRSSSGDEHLLSEIVMEEDDIPVRTEDHDAIIENDIFENRHSVLSFCEKNHYQFDSLRRAKHSSMMILYHLYKNIHLSLEKEHFEGHGALKVKLMGALVHASQCCAALSNHCSFSGCIKVKQLFQHVSRCSHRVAGGCALCRKIWSLLHWHSQTCHDTSCVVPRCKDIKKHGVAYS
ncbi:probable histone acetyltransferase HAC-like 1 [Solanum pennellii]|uniref:histone acetyltransferase n=1 Tax=Solanum pennellii TaxID=28526 RepID=A0ABM1GSH2_SOLPN|nr:probable histone acetyltransferase HAC-like 1 [Solanum pennellii]